MRAETRPDDLSDPSEPFAPGDLCEQRYRIIRRLKAGGYGVVYEAEHSFTGAHVALKALYNRAGDHPERMRLEARALAEIRHPNVVQVTDGGVTTDGIVWFTMELLTGRTLREELYATGPLGVERALRFGRQIADGVAAAHALSVIHRDLKPENVFIVQPGDGVRVLDFGTSKFRDSTLKTTDRFRILGTHAYMSPERLLANVVDHRADVFALGHILYEMVSGAHSLSDGPGPLDFPPPYELGMRQIYAPPPPLAERAKGTPEYVTKLIERALAKDRSKRQQSMAELGFELTQARTRYLREIGARELDRPGAWHAPTPHRSATGAAQQPSGITNAPHIRTEPLEAIPSERSLAAEKPSGPPSMDLARLAEGRIPLASFEAESIDGAARFAAQNDALPILESLRWLLSIEREDVSWLAFLQQALIGVASASEGEVAMLRQAVTSAPGYGRSAMSATLDPFVRLAADHARTRELNYEEGNSRIYLGAARLVPTEYRIQAADQALGALASASRVRHDLTVVTLIAFSRTETDSHPKARDALMRLLLGTPHEQSAAEDTLLRFVSVCMKQDRRLLFGASNVAPQALGAELNSGATPAAMTTPVREPTPKAPAAAALASKPVSTPRIKLGAALGLATAVAVGVIGFGFMLRKPRASEAEPAPAVAPVSTSSRAAPVLAPPPMEVPPDPAPAASVAEPAAAPPPARSGDVLVAPSSPTASAPAAAPSKSPTVSLAPAPRTESHSAPERAGPTAAERERPRPSSRRSTESSGRPASKSTSGQALPPGPIF